MIGDDDGLNVRERKPQNIVPPIEILPPDLRYQTPAKNSGPAVKMIRRSLDESRQQCVIVGHSGFNPRLGLDLGK